MTPDEKEYEIKKFIMLRQAARTNLYYLVHDVLKHDWVNHKVHDEMGENMPKFRGGTDKLNDAKTGIEYRPDCSVEELEKESGIRNIMTLYPRGSLKTTYITEGGIIQAIINYPDIRIGLVTAIGEQGQAVFDVIRKHFQFNEHLRALFPELCPPAKSAADWGNQEAFTVCHRPVHRKEPTLSLMSVGKVIAGFHYDMIFLCDVVDWTTAETPGQLAKTNRFCGYLDPLIEHYPNGTVGWMIVEGTTYDYADFYGQVRDREENREPKDREWKIKVKSARNPDGTLLWPERISEDFLSKKEAVEPFLVASQYYMNPVPSTGGLCSKDKIVFTPAHLLNELRPSLNIYCTVDLAGMDEDAVNIAKNDDTVLNVSGWDRDGRIYALEITAGKPTPHQVIALMFDIQRRFNPIAFKIEKDSHARVLKPFLRREMEKRGVFLTLVLIQRDNRKSKKQRIAGLQPWFQAGLIRFSDQISCKAELINQIVRFSRTSSYHDDILDTITDHCFRADGEASYDVIPNAPKGSNLLPFPMQDRFMGFDPITGMPDWTADRAKSSQYDPMTGVL